MIMVSSDVVLRMFFLFSISKGFPSLGKSLVEHTHKLIMESKLYYNLD